MHQQKHGTLVVTQNTIRPHLEQVSHGLAAALSAIEQATGIPGGSLSFTLQRPGTDTLYQVDISEIRPPDHFYTLMTAAKVIGKVDDTPVFFIRADALLDQHGARLEHPEIRRSDLITVIPPATNPEARVTFRVSQIIALPSGWLVVPLPANIGSGIFTVRTH